MRPTARQQSALLWGVVGALGFLSLHQAYLLLGGAFVGIGPVAGLAAVVFASTTVSAYYAEQRFGLVVRRLDPRGRGRDRDDIG